MPDTCENPETPELTIISELTIHDHIIPDGLSNPMSKDDLKMVRRYRPDLDEKIMYAVVPDDDD